MKFLPINQVQTYCPTLSSNTPSTTPPPSTPAGCASDSTIPLYVWSSATGGRVAVQYQDGHVGVWDRARNRWLISNIKADFGEHAVWLSADGSEFAADVQGQSTGPDMHAFNFTVWQLDDQPVGVVRPLLRLDVAATSALLDTEHGQVAIAYRVDDFTEDFAVLDATTGDTSASFVAPLTPAEDGSSEHELSADAVAVDQTTSAYEIASEGQSGYITWTPGGRPHSVDLSCFSPGAFSADGHYFACQSTSARLITLWDVRRDRLVRRWPGSHVYTTTRVNGVGPVFLQNGQYLGVSTITAGQGRWIDVYRVSDQKAVSSHLVHSSDPDYDESPIWPYGNSIITTEQLSGSGGSAAQLTMRTFSVP